MVIKKGIAVDSTGKPIDKKEWEHFTQCHVCHQRFDMRDLSQVCEHEHSGIAFEAGETTEH